MTTNRDTEAYRFLTTNRSESWLAWVWKRAKETDTENSYVNAACLHAAANGVKLTPAQIRDTMNAIAEANPL